MMMNTNRNLLASNFSYLGSTKFADILDKNLLDIFGSLQGPHSDFTRPTSGCTTCVAITGNNQLTVANAGDSHGVISRKGEVIIISIL